MHKRTLYSACVRLRVMRACANSRTRHTKTRLEATLPFRTLEMQLQFSLHAGLFTSGGMLPSAKAHAYARPILLHVLAITLLRHAHAHMHALHNVHMRVPYGTESLPKTSLADAALHGCSLTRRSNMA